MFSNCSRKIIRKVEGVCNSVYWYYACEHCCFKSNESLYCSKCGHLKNYPENKRFRLHLLVSSTCGELTYITVFGRCLNPIFGITAEELSRLESKIFSVYREQTLITEATELCLKGRWFQFSADSKSTSSFPNLVSCKMIPENTPGQNSTMISCLHKLMSNFLDNYDITAKSKRSSSSYYHVGLKNVTLGQVMSQTQESLNLQPMSQSAALQPNETNATNGSLHTEESTNSVDEYPDSESITNRISMNRSVEEALRLVLQDVDHFRERLHVRAAEDADVTLGRIPPGAVHHRCLADSQLGSNHGEADNGDHGAGNSASENSRNEMGTALGNCSEELFDASCTDGGDQDGLSFLCCDTSTPAVDTSDTSSHNDQDFSKDLFADSSRCRDDSVERFRGPGSSADISANARSVLAVGDRFTLGSRLFARDSPSRLSSFDASKSLF